MNSASELLVRIASNMADAGFKVSHKVLLRDSTVAELAGSRTQFSWKSLTALSQHMVVRHFERPAVRDGEALFESAFRFGKRANRVPLIRGVQFGYVIFPVLLAEKPGHKILQKVAKPPAKRWALFEFPVVVDLSNGKAAYFQGTAKWGALYYSDFRRVIQEVIENALLAQSRPINHVSVEAPSTQSNIWS